MVLCGVGAKSQTIGSIFPKSGGAIVDSFQTNPYTLFYGLTYLPPQYDSAQYADSTFPVILAFHGDGEGYLSKGNNIASLSNLLGNGMPSNLAAGQTLTYNGTHFIVVCPQSYNGEMYGFNAMEILLSIERKYRVDKSRIYEMGYSYGGYSVWHTMTDDTLMTKSIAAAALMSAEEVESTPVATSYTLENGWKTYTWTPILWLQNAGKYKVPLWLIDNTQDQFYGLMQKDMDTVLKYGGNITTSWNVGNGHNSWVTADGPNFGVFQWFLTHKLGVSATPPISTATVAISVTGTTFVSGTIITVTDNGIVIGTFTVK